MRLLSASWRAWSTTGVFVAAILVGGALGAGTPTAAAGVASLADPLILALVGALFFTLRLDGIAALRRAPRTALLAVGMNFLAIPIIAVALTAIVPDDALRLGVLIYCLAPCTDWFLGFTRLAGGDTTIGAALIPVQMLLQLLLYPLWLALFAGEHVESGLTDAGSTLLTWFILPAAIGLGMRLLVGFCVPAHWRRRVLELADRSVPALIAAVIVAIFAGNVGTILADPGAFLWVLVVVFLFFAATYALGEAIGKVVHLRYSERALLVMTTSSRNAPLMLALTTVALPDQPIVHAAIILGMLIEFPHLTVVAHLLRRGQAGRAVSAGSAVSQPSR